MPHRNWVADQELLAADLQTFVQNQVVATFASAAARASEHPSPVEGAVSYLLDTDVLNTWNGSAWVPVGPRGYLASAFRTDDLNISAITNIDYTNVTTPALPAGRRVKVTADYQFGNAASSPAVQAIGYITDGANAIHAQRLSYTLTSSAQSVSAAITITALLTPGAGALTVKARAGSQTAGAGGLYIQECLLVVEDIGAV